MTSEKDFKIIQDPVHGSIKLSGLPLELLATPEMQRLSGIRQLGLAYLVFPGANHTRIEHSLGVGYVASRIAKELGLDETESNMVTAAGLLHDVGHGPFSHTLEGILHARYGIDHAELTREIVCGKYDMVPDFPHDKFGGDGLPVILEKYGLKPSEVADLITGTVSEAPFLEMYIEKSQTFFNEKRYMAQIIHSAIDADQIDYLLRDAHYTGVAHGTIDADRLLQILAVFHNELVVQRKGVSAAEGVLVARALMYSSVYFHRTSRLCQLMLARAVERMGEQLTADLQKMTDQQLLTMLDTAGTLQNETLLRLKYRRLFKSAYMESEDGLSTEEKEALLGLLKPGKRREKEDEICRRAGLPEGSVIIDLPAPELLLSEPRIASTEIKVLEDDRLKPLSKYSSLSKALQRRTVASWAVMLASPPECGEAVAKVGARLLFE